MNRKVTWGTFAAAAVGAVSLAVVSFARSGPDAAISEVQRIGAKPPDTAVVATVNGEPISRRSIDITAAMTLVGDLNDASGLPVGAPSREELLDKQIESVLLVQAAEKAGIAFTEDEVTLTINSGLVGPLTSDEMPADMKKVGLARLALAGVSTDTAVRDPGIREAFRRWGMASRYVSSSKVSRDELLRDAMSTATIVKYLDVLNAPH